MFTPETNHALLRAQVSGEAGTGAQNTPEEIRQAAEQFEALFVQGMLKQVRANSDDGLFGSSRMTMVQEMFDAEIARSMAEAGGLGLADMLVRQLGHGREASPGTSAILGREQGGPATRPASPRRTSRFETPAAFVETMLPLARKAAARLNVPAEAIVAQSALETGWGRHMLNKPDGDSAWNLFGIKDQGNWPGDSVEAVTLEVRDGVAQRETANFRAYGSPAESIDDYIGFLAGNPRYASVFDQPDVRSFARALQEAGYATDPDYAAKIERVARDIVRQQPGATAQVNEDLADV